MNTHEGSLKISKAYSPSNKSTLAAHNIQTTSSGRVCYGYMRPHVFVFSKRKELSNKVFYQIEENPKRSKDSGKHDDSEDNESQQEEEEEKEEEKEEQEKEQEEDEEELSLRQQYLRKYFSRKVTAISGRPDVLRAIHRSKYIRKIVTFQKERCLTELKSLAGLIILFESTMLGEISSNRLINSCHNKVSIILNDDYEDAQTSYWYIKRGRRIFT